MSRHAAVWYTEKDNRIGNFRLQVFSVYFVPCNSKLMDKVCHRRYDMVKDREGGTSYGNDPLQGRRKKLSI